MNYHPISSLANGVPIEFDVSSSSKNYMDLANSLLNARAKIVKTEGSNMAANETVVHTLFLQMDVTLKGTLITSSMNTYSHKAYLETLLSYGPVAIK